MEYINVFKLIKYFENDLWCDNKDMVKDKVRDFFKSRYDEDDELPVRLDNASFNFISSKDNGMLVGAITEEEVKLAVWSHDNSKSPEPNEFNFSFVKFCWELLKEDIIMIVNEFAGRGKWSRGFNVTFISLIPKVNNPQQVYDYRPISLVGCLYKIVSNILSLRLKKVINKVIDH